MVMGGMGGFRVLVWVVVIGKYMVEWLVKGLWVGSGNGRPGWVLEWVVVMGGMGGFGVGSVNRLVHGYHGRF